jgi:hypothetical protein
MICGETIVRSKWMCSAPPFSWRHSTAPLLAPKSASCRIFPRELHGQRANLRVRGTRTFSPRSRSLPQAPTAEPVYIGVARDVDFIPGALVPAESHCVCSVLQRHDAWEIMFVDIARPRTAYVRARVSRAARLWNGCGRPRILKSKTMRKLTQSIAVDKW